MPKPKLPNRETYRTADGRVAGEVSHVFGFCSSSLSIKCKWHGCRFMIRTAKIIKPELIKTWVLDGENMNGEAHARAFYPTTQIEPPPPRGQGRARGSRG